MNDAVVQGPAASNMGCAACEKKYVITAPVPGAGESRIRLELWLVLTDKSQGKNDRRDYNPLVPFPDDV